MKENNTGYIIPIIDSGHTSMSSIVRDFLGHCHNEINFDDDKGLASITYIRIESLEREISEWYDTEYTSHVNVLPSFMVYLLYLDNDENITDVKLLTHCYFKHTKGLFLQHIILEFPIRIESRCLYDIKITEDNKNILQKMYNKYKDKRLELEHGL